MKPVKVPGLKGKHFLHDPKMQLAVAGTAVVGLVVLYKKRGQAAAGSTDQGGGSTPAGLNTGQLDSTGTDMYNAVSSLGQGWENDLRDYSGKLDSLSTQIQKNTTGLQSVNTTVGKLGQTKTVASVQGFQAVKLDKTGVLGVGKKYGLSTKYIMALPQNAGLRGLNTTTALGKNVYIPAGFRPKVVAKKPAPKKKK